MSPINTYTSWHPFLRPVARAIVLAHLAVALQPLSAIAQERGVAPVNPGAQSQIQRLADWNQRMEQGKARQQIAQSSPTQRASADLARLDELSQSLVIDLRARGLAKPAATSKAGQTGVGANDKETRAIGPNMRIEVAASAAKFPALGNAQREQHQKELRELLARQAQGQAATQAEMAQTRAELVSKKLPTEILARHDAAVAAMGQRLTRFNTIAKGVEAAATDAALASSVQDLRAFFDEFPAMRHVVKDPTKMPWRAPEQSKRLPAETTTAWSQQVLGEQGIAVAQAGGGSIGPLNFTVMPDANTAPTTADLAETPEVQLTAPIRAKATELGNNPVQIHNWVRNTVEWVPTWGAVQNAQTTLDKKSGNAFDIASLEIALLRAANIPARYQLGTIEVGADQLQNWVGGVDNPSSAQQLIGQGGIANLGITEGGRIGKLRMEHVWVQAYVNWAPARGAKQGNATQHPNPKAPLNAWVPMDASYKQYTYGAGMSLQTAVPLDAQSLLDAAQQGATVNEAQGWVQNLNQAAIQSQLTDYQARLKAHIESSPNGANTTVGEVIGRKIIPQEVPSLLAGAVSNTVVKEGAQLSALPATLQHRFSFSLSTAGALGAFDGPVLSYSARVSDIAGKRITLSYAPASQADADLIASYLPKPHADGSPIQPSELPSSLPGYLIHLKPQISLDGQVVATSSTSFTMGTELSSTGGFTQLYNPSQWDLTQDDSHVVGQATAIGISAGGVSASQLEALKLRLETTKTTLQSGDQAAIGALNGEQVSGDLLTATIWSWFAAAESHNRLSQNQAGMVEVPGLSYGLFHAVAQPIYSWGIVRQVKFPGVNLDIGHIRNLGWAKDNDKQKWIGYNRLRGQYMSALEHAIPERFFNDPASCNIEGSTTQTPGLPACPKGVSAVQALGVAAQAGQKIYTITQAVYNNNPNIVSSALSAHSVDTRSAVQNALNAGLEVTIHEKPVTISGWTGAGYTMIDPGTGAGGYIIEGGSNGGWLVLLALISFAFPPVFFIYAIGLTTAAAWGSAAVLIASAIYALNKFVERLDKILSNENVPLEQRLGAIQAISFMTLVANVLTAGVAGAGKDGSAVMSSVFSLLISKASFMFDAMIDLFSWFNVNKPE